MMHLLRKYDIAYFVSNDAMFAIKMWRSHASLGEAVIIGAANIICRRQTSFKKRTFVGSRQKCVFCWRRRRDLNSRAGKTRPTPLAGAPLRPLEYFSVYLRRERPLQNSRRLLYTRFSLLSRPFTKKRNKFFRHRYALVSGRSVPST